MARIFITGSTEGLGRAAAQSLLDRGHEVVFHARSAKRAEALRELPLHRAFVVTGDLSSAVETADVAAQVNAIGRFDAVIHNAGIYSTVGRQPTMEGHAGILAVNILAPFILTALVTPPARLIFISSSLHRGGEGSLADLDWTTRQWDGGRAYAESKLHVIALAMLIARRWPNVMANAVDPGWVRTRMGGSGAPVDIETGQRTQSWLAVSDDPAAKVSGGYWHDMRQELPAPQALDRGFQDELAVRLEALTNVALP